MDGTCSRPFRYIEECQEDLNVPSHSPRIVYNYRFENDSAITAVAFA